MILKIKRAAYRTPVLILPLALVLMLLTGCGGSGSSNSVVNQTNPDVNNTVPVTVGFNSAGGPNGLFTSVTVCTPAVLPVGQNPQSGPPLPPTCQTISNILVDTGSVGLRVIDSDVAGLTLPLVTDNNGDGLQECVQFADFSYVWGPVARATIQMGGETASQVPLPNELSYTGIPIQIITSPDYLSNPVPANCLSSSPAGGMPMAANTLETLGANGILGVGNFLQDCGATCASSTPGNQYYYCPSSLCSVTTVPLDLQLWNPVAAFAWDNNGLMLSLPSVPLGGSGPITGSMTFGVGSQSNNTLSNVNIYGIDAYGNFPQVTLIQPANPNTPPIPLVNYLSPQNGSYLDTGSPAIYFSDAQSLAIPECLGTDGQPLGLYCPASLTQFTAKVYGTNNTVGLPSWYVANAVTLLHSGNAVFDTLCGDTGIDVETDYVDFGLPFFLGSPVFVGFAGATVASSQTTYPVTYANGFWAF
jgi:hypothetical protein